MIDAKKNLLIVSSGYPNKEGDYLSHTFVKGFADEAKDYFNKVKILVLIPYFPFYKKKGRKINLKNYSYENIDVFYKKYFYIPIWPFTKYRGLIAYMVNSRFAKKIIDKSYFIHANFTSPAGVFVNHLCENLKLDYTLTVHEDHNWLMDEIRSKNRLLISAWKNAKTIIRVNDLDSKELRFFNSNVVTIPNGFNHKKFKRLNKNQCRLKLGYSIEDKIIVNIGFYNEQKNQKNLIDAIHLLPKEAKSNLRCLIIGGGPKEGELRRYITSLRLDNTIFLLGQKKHDELPIYLNSADIFCLSSNSEGNPTVMFEALGTGLPYVGTNVGGVKEIIRDDQHGLLCNPKDAQGLSKIIHKGLVKNWDNEEILRYSKSFTWKNIFLKTKELY